MLEGAVQVNPFPLPPRLLPLASVFKTSLPSPENILSQAACVCNHPPSYLCPAAILTVLLLPIHLSFEDLPGVGGYNRPQPARLGRGGGCLGFVCTRRNLFRGIKKKKKASRGSVDPAVNSGAASHFPQHKISEISKPGN